jgi:beta-1,4-mannosyl-glycoprotein beta-1,4-N-acetylglucosaminyltransferase
MLFDELMLLEIRLKELSPVVDKFVLVEATHTHSGIPKRLYYDEVKDSEVFAPFKDKIIHLIYDEPMEADRFANDRNQRNYIVNGLTDAEPDDIIIVSDLDEIVDHRAIPVMEQTSGCGRLIMKLFYYYFNCRASQDWIFAAFCRFRNYETANKLRLDISPAFSGNIINAGWHFSYLVPPEKIPKKLEAFAHAEFDTDYHKDTERLKRCVEAGMDIFERDNMTFSIEPLDAPQCVMENEDKYRQFIKR